MIITECLKAREGDEMLIWLPSEKSFECTLPVFKTYPVLLGPATVVGLGNFHPDLCGLSPLGLGLVGFLQDLR